MTLKSPEDVNKNFPRIFDVKLTIKKDFESVVKIIFYIDHIPITINSLNDKILS